MEVTEVPPSTGAVSTPETPKALPEPAPSPLQGMGERQREIVYVVAPQAEVQEPHEKVYIYLPPEVRARRQPPPTGKLTSGEPEQQQEERRDVPGESKIGPRTSSEPEVPLVGVEVVPPSEKVEKFAENVAKSDSGNGQEKISEPLNFSTVPPASEARSPLKMDYEKRDVGRQRKYYQTIALLEKYYAGDTRIWDRLDAQMQRYYRREYPEYFGRTSKVKQKQREENKIKAARIRQERLQRQYRRSASLLPGD